MQLKQVYLISGMLVLSVAISACVTHKGPDATNSQKNQVGRTASSGERTKIWSNYTVEEDCSSGAVPNMKVASQPAHGKVDIVTETVSPNIPKGNVRFKCNSRKYPASVAYYTSNGGYEGADKVELVTAFRGVKDSSFTAVSIRVSQ